MLEHKKPDNQIHETANEPATDTFPHILFELSPDGMFTYVNQRALDITGYTREDISLGLHISQVVLPEDRERVRINIEKIIEGEIIVGNEYTIIRKDGTTFPVVSYSEAVKQTGQVPHIRGLLVPLGTGNYYESVIISERRRSQDILDITGNIIVTLYPDGKIRAMNRRGYEALECPDDVAGCDWFEKFIPAEHRSQARTIFSKIASGETVNRATVCREVMTCSGKIMIFDWHYNVIRIANAKVFGVMFSGEDITERTRLEQQLRESEEKYRVIFREARDGIVLIDAETGEIVECNPEYERQTGRSREHLIWMKAWDVATPGTMESYRDLFFHELLDRKARPRDLSLQTPDGKTLFIEYSIDRMEIGGRRFIQCIGRDISERKAAELALKESEERFSCAFMSSPASMAIVDETGIILEVNDSYARSVGCDWEEMLGHSIGEYKTWINTYEETRVKGLFEKNGRLIREECHFRLSSGEIQTVILSMEKIVLNGQPCRIIVNSDITERKKAEAAFRESEERFSRAFHSSPEAMMITTVEEGRIVEANDVALDSFGFTREELIGNTIFELGIVLDMDTTGWVHEEMENAGRIHNVELEFRTKAGELRTMLFSLEEISIGGTPCYVSVQSDISERKRIEQALEESEEKFSVAFHLNPSMMILIGIETGEYLEVNDSFCRATGYLREELIGVRVDALDMWVDQDEKNDMLRRMAEDNYVHDAEYRFKMKSGSIRTWLCSTDIITIGGRQRALSVAIDITKRKEAEAELELMYETESGLREQLEEEMKRRAEFTRALVHELKTPLTPIAASSEVLAMIVTGEPLKSMAENINRGAYSLNKRIDELLELARSELNVLRIDPFPMDLIPLLREIESEMASIASHHRQKLTVEIPPTLGVVNADAGRIRQVLENLLTNAFKYTPDGGEITVRARMEESNVIVDVQDNGPGLSSSEAERIFQPYYRKERDRDHLSGLGLGLALSKTLIDLHHGEIWVSTLPNKGSTFSFSLPLAHR